MEFRKVQGYHTYRGGKLCGKESYLFSLLLSNEDNNIGPITYNINAGNYPNEILREKRFVNINLQHPKI